MCSEIKKPTIMHLTSAGTNASLRCAGQSKECQVLNIKLLSLSLIVFLSACGASQPPPYQKDRAPEDRDQYSGAEGLTQQQKDQTYLMSKELSDKCTAAKIDLAIAETGKNASEIKKQNALISSTCI